MTRSGWARSSTWASLTPPAWVVAQMQTLAADRGWSTFAGLQVEYSLVQREVERELIPMARGLGLGILAWGPLGAGSSAPRTPDRTLSAANESGP